jgi:glutamate-1-semialdehyde 2,1-aminomutase
METAYAQLCAILPAGVNSPARAFTGLGMQPLVVRAAQGAELVDLNGNRFVDFCGSWGAAILGHSPPEVVRAASAQLARGTSFGFTSLLEGQLAQRVSRHYPSMARLRLVSSGTEATMTAVRLARAFTRRERILKFNGNYHGHSDGFLVQAGSAVAACSPTASSRGVPRGVIENTWSLPYNDCTAIEELFARAGEEIAAVIVEPIAGNMGVVAGTPAFLQTLRRLTRAAGSLLIFDEVITGFRVGLGGAQGLYAITPDLTCLGKIIGGGFPLAIVGGSMQIMEQLAPLGEVFQAGTLSGNAVAVTAALATLDVLEEPGFYEDLQQKTDLLCQPIERLIARGGLNGCLQRVGSMWTLFLGQRSLQNMEEVKKTSLTAFGKFFHRLYAEKILLPPSPYEAAFVSRAHSEKQVQRVAAIICDQLAASHSD